MPRRERLERKLEKRREWAGKAEVRSEARFDTKRDCPWLVTLRVLRAATNERNQK